MKNDFEISLTDFKGPLDLLLHLIDKNKVDIYDIPIVEITKQYMEYIDRVEDKLSIASDFLVTAATLISIKTKMLLPSYDEDEEDPRTELVQQLLEYKYFKEVSEKLHELENNGYKSIVKAMDLPEEVKEFEYKPNVLELFSEVSISDIENIFLEALKRAENRKDKLRHDFKEIQEDVWTVENMMTDIKKRLSEVRSCSFYDLITKNDSKLKLVVTFLAILEMIKFGEIRLKNNYDAQKIDIEVVSE